MRGSRVWVVVLLVGFAGCGRTPAPPADTGARKILQEYCDAVVLRDWKKAHAALHPDNQRRWTTEQFSHLAEASRRRFGFEPQKVHIRSCEEQGTQAVAHVVFTGRTASRSQRYQDGMILRQSAAGWRVVLPGTFAK